MTDKKEKKKAPGFADVMGNGDLFKDSILKGHIRLQNECTGTK